jgi:hypothetical protein
LFNSQPDGAPAQAESIKGPAATRANAREEGEGIGSGVVWLYGPARPSSCSEAAAVVLRPSVRSAIDIAGPKMNTPSATVASPPRIPQPARKPTGKLLIAA